ncbi:MAG TPA: rhomboid family intramembrane serine protease [Flavobacteriales bacterium]|nr:rhomboid family intramembrane serine protease [Flavobacteriales bacterium]HRE74413.1 rhomboid family intramembrane serine protease [Flavobacteriales bacterium]HRE96506.1 rhomboid family intramembrane serine protease [Flavobacteriales bacterium]HRJ35193.1 rhomboid family intramembrane serine protease [Flavobacteriales bacterium]HRJ40040.1 rhomboid family intramembrane serine protease [Flavobacteriales bacterium]
MIEHYFRTMPPVIKNFLIINVLVFLATSMYVGPDFNLKSFLAVYFVKSDFFQPYQIITHMFTHVNFMHLFFNMFAMVMFGTILERQLGTKRFFILYFSCGLGALALYQSVAFIEYSVYLDQINSGTNSIAAPFALLEILYTPAMGASGAIFGMLMLFMLLYPETEFILFPIPFRIKAKYYLPVLIYIEFYFGLQQLKGNESNVAHFAHLGGALIGLVFYLVWRKKRIV